MKHTPGPWIFVPKDDNTSIYPELGIFADYGRRKWIACAYDSFEHLAEAKANARLVAAAPEMLEALQCLLELREPLSDICDRAKGVIAKATGAK